MDKYQEAIEKDEFLKEDFILKKSFLEKKKAKTKTKKRNLENKNENLIEQLEDANKLQDYYDNKDMKKRNFIKKALRFGIKNFFGFSLFFVLFNLFANNLDSSTILKLKEILISSAGIGSILGLVEYYNVTREIRDLKAKKSNHHNPLYIEELTSKIEKNKNIILEYAKEIVDLGIDLDELDVVINELETRIFTCRTKRNALINSLVEKLDNHITDGFEYVEYKVKEKRT